MIVGSAVGNPAQGEPSSPLPALQVRDLKFAECPKKEAIDFTFQHHSRLPVIHNIGLSYAFSASTNGTVVATAIWSRPIARTLPRQWWELRRMACSPEMPSNGASSFLNWMVRYLKKNHPDCDRFISYQDTEVHEGTIYKAAGWTIGATSTRANWTKHPRPSTKQNGDAPLQSPKVRWDRIN